MRWTLLLALLPSLALAQSPTPRPEDLGTVTGHITCADTQRPARFAQVTLVATKTPAANSEDETLEDAGTGGPVHTDLTGSYTIHSVPPGKYSLRVDLSGYATPISKFTSDELNSPTPEVQQRIQRELQLLTVTPNSTVRADATIHRGGSISGTVTWDDGSPAIGIEITPLRRNANGKLGDFLRTNPVVTGSHGQFSIESLLPDEYVLRATLHATERLHGQRIYGDGRRQDILMEMPTFSLPIYSGNVFREKEATIIKVDAGEETDSADMTIPLGRLHEISGTLLAAGGHTIDNARVDLLFADTQQEFAGIWVHEHGVYRLPYVPEGSYILKVTHAFDFYMVEVPDSPTLGSQTTHFEQRTTRSYGDLEQPLTVQTDIQSLNLTLPDKPTTTPTE